MTSIVSTIKDYLAGLLEREAARLITTAGALTVAAALFVAAQLGVTLSEDSAFVLAVAGLVAVAVEEAIRKAVFSLKTHTEKVAEAAATGNPNP